MPVTVAEDMVSNRASFKQITKQSKPTYSVYNHSRENRGSNRRAIFRVVFRASVSGVIALNETHTISLIIHEYSHDEERG